jgi:autotransporter-associated beta strand protein
LDFTGGLPGGNYVISGGTLDVNGLSKSIGTFQITGGTVNGSGTLTSSAAYDLQSGTVNAVLGGSVGLNKSSTGTVSLTGGLPGGNYVISDGTLNLNGLSKTIETFQITGGVVSDGGTLTSNAAFDVQGGTVQAVLAGLQGLTKTQDTTATLEGDNQYLGPTVISAGTLALANEGQISPLSEIDNSATFLIADDTAPHTVGVIAGTGVTRLPDGAELTAASITQGALVIGGSGAAPGACAGAGAEPVPEPSVWILLALSGLGFLGAAGRRK